MGCFITFITLATWAVWSFMKSENDQSNRLEVEFSSTHDSDAEYLRRMPSSVSRETAIKVRRILANVSGWDDDEIWPETLLGDMLE